MKTVKCFKHDTWQETDVYALEVDDIFSHQGKTYIVKGKPYLLEGKPNIPAELYESGTIILNFDKNREYIHMVMDYVFSPAVEFDDGSMIIADLSDGSTNVYSPRLPISKLNEFCKQNLEHYENFFHKHERKLESGESIQMPKFWNKTTLPI